MSLTVSPSVHVSAVFVFMDLVSDDQASFPKEFQEKYLVSRGIGTYVLPVSTSRLVSVGSTPITPGFDCLFCSVFIVFPGACAAR